MTKPRVRRPPARTLLAQAKQQRVLAHISVTPSTATQVLSVVEMHPDTIVGFLCRMVQAGLIHYELEVAKYPSGKRYRRRVYHAGADAAQMVVKGNVAVASQSTVKTWEPNCRRDPLDCFLFGEPVRRAHAELEPA